LAKIKDCKGKDLNFSTKKKLPTKTPPKLDEKPFWSFLSFPTFPLKWDEME